MVMKILTSLLVVSGGPGISAAPCGGFGALVLQVGLAGMRRQKEGYLVDRMLIVLAAAANIADPGGKIGHGDQLIHQPGEIRDACRFHVPGLADGAGMLVGFDWICHFLF